MRFASLNKVKSRDKDYYDEELMCSIAEENLKKEKTKARENEKVRLRNYSEEANNIIKDLKTITNNLGQEKAELATALTLQQNHYLASLNNSNLQNINSDEMSNNLQVVQQVQYHQAPTCPI